MNLLQNLPEPPRKYSPVPIWWWSGGQITEKIITYEMEKWCEQGVYNLMIMNVAPTSSMFGKDVDHPQYMTEKWWQLFQFTCETAKRLGMYIWFYDQIGFSGANFPGRVTADHPEYTGQSLVQETMIANDGERISMHGTMLAAFSAPAGADGQPCGAFEMLTVTDNSAEVNGNHRFVRCVGFISEGMDFLNPQACQELISRIHEQFAERCEEYMGSVIVGSFQDELGKINSWSDGFAEAFLLEKGYDLIPHLNELYSHENSRSAMKTRRDYQDVRAKLAEKAFFRPCYEWHEKYGIGCGTDQTSLTRAGNTIDTVCYYADYMRNERWYEFPGCDLMGNSHIHASIANTNGRSRVWLEAFHSTGWGGTLEETFDWLLPWYGNGANLYDPHGGYATLRGGCFEWAPPSNGVQQAGFKDYKPFADSITRMSYLMSQGSHVSDIAVLYPTTAAQAVMPLDTYFNDMDIQNENVVSEESLKIQKCYEELTGRMHWFEDPVEGEGILSQCKADYDILGEVLFEEGSSSIEEGAVHVRDLKYHTVILPECYTVSPETAKALVEFVKQGGCLIAVGVLPKCLDEEYEEVYSELHTLFAQKKAFRVETGEEIRELLKKEKRMVEAPVPTLLRKADDTYLLYVPAAEVQATWNCKGSPMTPLENTYDFDPGHYARNMQVTIRDADADIFYMNLLTGEVLPAQFSIREKDRIVTLPFEELPVTILLWKAGEKGKVLPAVPHVYEEVADLGETWRYRVTPTLDNELGDFELPPYPGSPKLQTWYVKELAEHGEMEVRTTFGPQAWYQIVPAESVISPFTVSSPKKMLEAVEGWKQVIYSKTGGIDKDPMNAFTLGAGGHIPDEFIDCGILTSDQKAIIRTGIYSEEERSVFLVLGAAQVDREVWLNGEKLTLEDTSYQTFLPVKFLRGMNTLEVRFRPLEDILNVRAYWTLTDDVEKFRKPQFLSAEKARLHKQVEAVYEFELKEIPKSAVFSFGATYAFYDLKVNGKLFRGADSFSNYQFYGTGVTTAMPDNWVIGRNTLVIEMNPMMPFDEEGTSAVVPYCMLDGYLEFSDGSRKKIKTDKNWKVDEKAPVFVNKSSLGIGSLTTMNISSICLNTYPKSLPGFEWVETEVPEVTALEAMCDPYFGQQRKEVFTWKIPGAASRMYLSVGGSVHLTIDGKTCEVSDGIAELPEIEGESGKARLEVIPLPGYAGGAVFKSPIRYDTDRTAEITLGDWQEKALESWSGGITYIKEIEIPDGDGELWLDLGRVRGTVECFVDGKSIGSRFLTPYRFRISEYRNRRVKLELMVTNTLAPYLKAASPTLYTPAMQLVSGMFGPVKILLEKEK